MRLVQPRSGKDPETLFSLLTELREFFQNPQGIYAGPSTRICCSYCGTETAPRYILRHWNGVYKLLCAQDDGTGCYDQDIPPQCGHDLGLGGSCTYLSEWRVTDANGNLIANRCSSHLGAVLSGAPEYRVFPLEK